MKKVVDAKFKVVRPKRPLHLYIDWTNFWLIALVGIVPLAIRLILHG